MMPEKDILFARDIAQLLEISENTLRRKSWRAKTGIPLRIIGKKLCCSGVEFESWFKGTKVNP